MFSHLTLQGIEILGQCSRIQTYRVNKSLENKAKVSGDLRDKYKIISGNAHVYLTHPVSMFCYDVLHYAARLQDPNRNIVFLTCSS